MKKLLLGILAVSSLMLAIPSANAATITYDVSFSATNFSPASAPVDPVKGSFTITFDPTQSFSDSTTGITLDSLNISLGSTLGFSYTPGSRILEVGGIQNNVGGVGTGTDDFALVIPGFPNGPFVGGIEFFYNQGGSDTFDALTTSFTTTPLPAALPLFATGLGALGLFGWHRKRKAQAVAA